MALVRWNPWSDVFTLHNQIDQLLQSGSEGTESGGGTESFTLPVDIRQTDDAFIVEASVPGFDPKNVEVTFENSVLTITGTHKDERESRSEGYVRRERRVGSVYRQIALPAEVRADEISATFYNGVLTITVPRAQKAQPKRIPVSTDAPAAGGNGSKVLEGQATGSAG